jgi:hypothetical protein
MERHFFVLVPTCWLNNPELGADELAVLMALAQHADSNGRCWPSQSRIAGMLKRSRSWVSGVITRLVDLGLVTRAHRCNADGGHSSCLYTIPDLARARAAAAAGQADIPAACHDTPCRSGRQELNPQEQKSPSDGASVREGGEGKGPQTVPNDWVPTAADVAWARQRFPDLDVLDHTERFLLSCRAKGYRYSDISAAWRRWLLEPKGRLPAKPSEATKPRFGNVSWREDIRSHNAAVIAEVDTRIAARQSLRLFQDDPE